MEHFNKSQLQKIIIYLIVLLILIGGVAAIVSKSWLISLIFLALLFIQIKKYQEEVSSREEKSVILNESSKFEDLKVELSEIKTILSKDEDKYNNFKLYIETALKAIEPKPTVSGDSGTFQPIEVMKIIAELIPYVEKRVSQFENIEDSTYYYSEKLVEILESFGLEAINQKTNFDIKLHEVSPPNWVAPDTVISKIIRPGIKKGNRVFVKAKVSI